MSGTAEVYRFMRRNVLTNHNLRSWSNWKEPKRTSVYNIQQLLRSERHHLSGLLLNANPKYSCIAGDVPPYGSHAFVLYYAISTSRMPGCTREFKAKGFLIDDFNISFESIVVVHALDSATLLIRLMKCTTYRKHTRNSAPLTNSLHGLAIHVRGQRYLSSQRKVAEFTDLCRRHRRGRGENPTQRLLSVVRLRDCQL